MSLGAAVEDLRSTEVELTPREREGDWVARAKQGDADAYGQLVGLYQERIYTTVYSMTGSHDEADDLTQEAFIKGFRSLKSFKENSSFFTWIYRIAVNKTINHLKSARRKRTMSLDQMIEEREGDRSALNPVSKNSPSRESNLRELREQLNAALQRLSEKHRIVVTLHDIQGMSHEEIAKILKVNNGTVRSRLFYARQQLQAELADYFQ